MTVWAGWTRLRWRCRVNKNNWRGRSINCITLLRGIMVGLSDSFNFDLCDGVGRTKGVEDIRLLFLV